MIAPIRAIAAATLKEALRSRLAWLLAALVLAAVALSGFLEAAVPTGGRATQAALLGALLRFSGMALVATFAVTAIVREYQDKGVELLLALPWPRAAWLLGRLAGLAALAVLTVLPAAVLALLLAPAPQAMLWAATLLAEWWIVAAFAAFCTVTLRHALPALCTTFGFYVLARSVTALQGAAAAAGSHDAMARAIDALAFLLPRLDGFARSEWLIYHTGSTADLALAALQTAVYLPLLAGAALFDLYRKEF